jgi:gas vesicle protein
MTPRWLIATVAAALLAGFAPQASAQLRKGPLASKAKAKRDARKAQAIDRFSEMSPEERQRVLGNLPPERRKRIEENLREYQNLSPSQKERLQHFHELPAEKQQAARKVFREMNALPIERKQDLRRELLKLRRMTPEDREARFQNEEFRGRFTADERRILQQMTELFPNEE